ncbi:unnamed protein product [Adineta steineri]|uniref:Multifunctional fusion protein n=1 Tax=Adineta steineri TaxID=433720 RepID=A0A815RFK3_9BILA|nr:unnamed protein product [Adineta steineri]CAF1637464.1 unnamed protein product [Adineta steineri]
MSESRSNQKASLPSNPFINNNSTTTVSSDIIQPRRRMVQNYSILWLDECMDETNKDYENILAQIRTIAENVNVFKQRDECIDFLTDVQEDIKSFLIVENAIVQQLMPLINDIPQLDSVHAFSSIKTLHEEPTKQWPKIKSVYVNIDDLYQRLQLGVKQYHQDSVAVSFIPVNEIAPTDNLNQLDPTFMYTQIFKDILLNMEHDKQAIKQFIAYCRHNDCVSPINIDRFDKEYHVQLAIWWYTFPSNIFSMLNYGLRTLDADIIITMGFFLRDVHQQIQQLYEQQFSVYGGKPFLVYRGQGLMKIDFEKLQKTKGGLMSFNNFLSTSKTKDVSLNFARCASTNSDTVGILFIMSIDPCLKSTPFASIKEQSYFKEEDEILFSMHTVFRVGTIKQIDNNNQLYQVELQLTSDDDQQLRLLTDRIRKEACGDSEWQRLGNLLLRIGQFNKAEELYTVLLEQTSEEDEKQHYYNQLGFVRTNQGNYEKALWYYEKVLKIKQKTLSSNHPDIATSYNNIGSVYDKMAEYPKAVLFYEKSLEICQKTLPTNHPLLATSYNNIGLAYNNMEANSRALSYYEKALEIREKTLPSNHPDIAISYNNIGCVYHHMGEYPKALSYYERALEIYQKTLPSNHPYLTSSYNNIGSVYEQMEENSKALSSHEKALEIFQKTLPSNHPLLATSYNNTAKVYYKMKDYSKALLYYDRSLDVFQRALPPTHPHIKSVKENIEIVKEEIKKNI